VAAVSTQAAVAGAQHLVHERLRRSHVGLPRKWRARLGGHGRRGVGGRRWRREPGTARRRRGSRRLHWTVCTFTYRRPVFKAVIWSPTESPPVAEAPRHVREGAQRQAEDGRRGAACGRAVTCTATCPR
jgi:hypothetical protein